MTGSAQSHVIGSAMCISGFIPSDLPDWFLLCITGGDCFGKCTVAGVGFEPYVLQVMSLASYRTALPRVDQDFDSRKYLMFLPQRCKRADNRFGEIAQLLLQSPSLLWPVESD